MSVIVSPSILSADFANLERDIKLVENAGADWLHIDVMDGHFVPNITIGIPVVKSLKKVTKLPLDVHLMIETPEIYAERFVKAGADILTFHYEAVKNNEEIIKLIKKIKSLGVKAGISIKPKTNPDVLLPFLSSVDMVLIMTVEPGFGGQKFMPESLEKISKLRSWIDAKQLCALIEVDGGINAETGKQCRQAGVDVLVAGSYVFKNDIGKAVESLV